METFSALLAICTGNSPVPGEFPTQRPVTRGFEVFFDLRLNKPLSKQSWGWWFEMLSSPLWRHCNAMTPLCLICTNFLTNRVHGVLISQSFFAATIGLVKTGSTLLALCAGNSPVTFECFTCNVLNVFQCIKVFQKCYSKGWFTRSYIRYVGVLTRAYFKSTCGWWEHMDFNWAVNLLIWL